MHASTIVIAFLAGLFSFFAPCGAVLLPSFFAYTFKKRSSLIAATWWFLAGFMTLFLPVGLGVRAFAAPLLFHRELLSWVGGLMFFLLAGLALAGRGLHVPVPKFLTVRMGMGRHNDAASAYLIGIIFGFTVAGCTAPLLGMVLAMASLSHATTSAIVILLSYGVGLAAPLLLLAFVAERAEIFKKPWLRGKIFNFHFAGKDRELHSSNAIAAVVLTAMGTVFIASQGTFFMAKLDADRVLLDFNVKMADTLSRVRQQ